MIKGNFLRSRKFRYGSLSVTLTALVVALVVMLNAGISALANKYGFYIDMTSQQFYTLSEDCRVLLDNNLKQTAADRAEFNTNLPSFNYTVAETNKARLDDTQTLAENNLTVADKNIAIAARNAELLAKSTALAEDNLDIAESNLKLAKSLNDYVISKEGGEGVAETENVKLAAAILAAAENNVKIAEANAETVAKNRSSASGVALLDTFAALEPIPGYKYYGAFTAHIQDTDTAVAARNKEIAAENKTIAAENAQIAAKNLEAALKNKNAGAVPGGAGYTAPEALKPYVQFEKLSAYLKISGAETPRAYDTYLETESESTVYGDMKVKIIFCDERDALYENTTQRYVLETAEDLQRAFPDVIELQFINVWTNPSAVQKYKGTTLSSIYSTNVIVESGTEWRVYSLDAFFTFDEDDTTKVLAYSGEKKLASGILAVIKAESPIACVTINHGESFTDYALLTLLSDAGYIVQSINLATDEIPADCRLMVIYNPTSDFLIKDSVSDISEIAKINTWLDKFNSLMVFMSPDSPVLPNLEEYLEEWGVVFDRATNKDTDEVSPYMIKDSGQSLTADGMTIISEYTTKGLGASIHKEMRSVPSPAKVIFKKSMSISYPDTYETLTYEDEDDATNNYRYGSYYSNGVSRSIYDVFVSSPNAVALAGGEQVAAASTLEPFKLMTITRETQMISNDAADYSYVIACASTDFASADMLQSIVYGNSDVLMSTMRTVAKETVVVDLAAKFFDVTDIETLTTAQANQYTIILSVIPAAIVLGLGIYVVVRRKYS